METFVIYTIIALSLGAISGCIQACITHDISDIFFGILHMVAAFIIGAPLTILAGYILKTDELFVNILCMCFFIVTILTVNIALIIHRHTD